MHCFAGDWLDRTAHVPLHVPMRILCTLADLGTLVLIAKLRCPARVTMIALALSPVAILVSGFHGNTDPAMVFFLIAAIFLLECDRADLSAVALGFACCIKVVPVILAPTILLYLKRSRSRYVLVAACTWLALSMPYILESPLTIARNVFGYRSLPGTWGITLAGLLASIEAHRNLHEPSLVLARILDATAILAIPVWTRRWNLDLFTRCSEKATILRGAFKTGNEGETERSDSFGFDTARSQSKAADAILCNLNSQSGIQLLT